MENTKKELIFYDTSALLLEAEDINFETAIVSQIVLAELETIKNDSKKDDYLKARARSCARKLVKDDNFNVYIPDHTKVMKVFKKFKDFLENKNDSLLLCEAAIYHEEHPECNLIFATGDMCQFLFANKLFKKYFTSRFVPEKSTARIRDGYRYITPTAPQLEKLYNNPDNENIFDLNTNEYAILLDERGKRIAYTRWDGTQYVELGYVDIKSPLFGKVSPRNAEQKIYMDLLQNTEIPIVSCISKRGTGKTWLAIVNGLDMVERGVYDKVIYLRNNWDLQGTRDLGSKRPRHIVIYG